MVRYAPRARAATDSGRRRFGLETPEPVAGWRHQRTDPTLIDPGILARPGSARFVMGLVRMNLRHRGAIRLASTEKIERPRVSFFQRVRQVSRFDPLPISPDVETREAAEPSSSRDA